MKLFREYEREASDYVTVLERDFYPDYLEQALLMYGPVIDRFGRLLCECGSSEALLRRIHEIPGPVRIQLLRVFRKYVSPMTSVEMLLVRRRMDKVVADFGHSFRPLPDVVEAFRRRPDVDEALAAVFWEHHDRGTPGYRITEIFFEWFEAQFAGEFTIIGPKRSGQDVQLSAHLKKFKGRVPADFLVQRADDDTPLIVGFARYDSDRGGSQEDDRPGGNQDKVNRIMAYAARQRVPLNVLFLNDGPGLLLGSMWRDYAKLETDNMVDGELRVMVTTLKMLDERLEAWLRM